jgi:hypothetical protein
MVFHVRPLRERRAKPGGLAKLTQVDHGRFALAPHTGRRRRTISADGPMTPAQTCSTWGSSSVNPTRRTFGLGWGTAWMASTSGGSMHH